MQNWVACFADHLGLKVKLEPSPRPLHTILEPDVLTAKAVAAGYEAELARLMSEDVKAVNEAATRLGLAFVVAPSR